MTWDMGEYMSGWVGGAPLTRGKVTTKPIQKLTPTEETREVVIPGAGPPAAPGAKPGVAGLVSGWMGASPLTGPGEPQTVRVTRRVMKAEGVLEDPFAAKFGGYDPAMRARWESPEFKQRLLSEASPHHFYWAEHVKTTGGGRVKDVEVAPGVKERLRTYTLPGQGEVRELTASERALVQEHNKVLQAISDLTKNPDWAKNKYLVSRVGELSKKLLPGQTTPIDPDRMYVWASAKVPTPPAKGTSAYGKYAQAKGQMTLPVEQYFEASKAAPELREAVARQAREFMTSAPDLYAKAGLVRGEKEATFVVKGGKGKPGVTWRPLTEKETSVVHAHNAAIREMGKVFADPNWAQDPAKVGRLAELRQYLLPGFTQEVNPGYLRLRK